jgi:hypothetical protein
MAFVQITEQEAFDRAILHMFRQGRQAVHGNSNVCAYRAADGCKCPVGAVLPDSLYRPKMEGSAVDHAVFNGVFDSGVRHILACIQSLHDGEGNPWLNADRTFDKPKLKEAVRKLAISADLSALVLDLV